MTESYTTRENDGFYTQLRAKYNYDSWVYSQGDPTQAEQGNQKILAEGINKARQHGQHISGETTGPFLPLKILDKYQVSYLSLLHSGRLGNTIDALQFAGQIGTTLYVNGIQTASLEHDEAAQHLADKLGVPVVGVYLEENGKDLIGFKNDIVRSVSDGASGGDDDFFSNPAIHRLRSLYDTYPSLNTIAHSEGNLVVAAALRQSKQQDKKDITQQKVTMLESPSPYMPTGPQYHDYAFDSDAVATIGSPMMSLVEVGEADRVHSGEEQAATPLLLRANSKLTGFNPHNVDYAIDHLDQFKQLSDSKQTPNSWLQQKYLQLTAPLAAYNALNTGVQNGAWNFGKTILNRGWKGIKTTAFSAARFATQTASKSWQWSRNKASAAVTWLGAKAHGAEHWAENKAYNAGRWLGDKAHNAGQWMFQHRAQIGDKLHLVSSILGGASAGLGIVAGGLALTGVGLPAAAVLGTLSLTLAAASAAAEAWYAVTKSVGTIDGSVTTGEANHAAAQAAKNLALTFVSVELSAARAVAKAKTMLEAKNALSFLHSDPRTVLQLDKATKFLNKLPGVNLGMVFRNASLAKRLKIGDLAMKVAQLPAKLANMGGIAGVLQTWHHVENKALGLAHKGKTLALTAVHTGRQAFQKIGRGGLHLLQNARHGLTSVGHGVLGHLIHLRSQATQLAAKAQQWARQGVHQGEAALLTGLASALHHSHTLAAAVGSLFGRSRGRILGGVTSAFTAALSQNLSAARSMLGFLEGGGHPKQIGSALHEVTRNLSGITHSIADTLGSAWGMDLHLSGPPHLPTRPAMPTFGRSPFSPMGGLPALAFSAPQAHGAGAQHLMGAWNPFSPQRSGGQQGGGLMALTASVVSGAAHDHLPHVLPHDLPSLLPAAAHSLGASALSMPGQVSGLLHHLTTPARHLLPHAMPERGTSPRQSAGLVRSTAHAAHTLLSPVQRALHQGALHTAGLRRSLPATPVLPTIRHLLPTHQPAQLAALLPGIVAHPMSGLHAAESRVQQAGHQALSHLPKVPAALANVGHGLGHFFQRSGHGDHPDVNPAALRADLRKQSSGFLPDGNIRARLGGHLGFDPGGARLHTGPAAASASRRLNAEAFTIGNDVFFGEGRFDPHTPKGLGLIAHELTHVGQQTGTTGSKARFFSEAGGDQMEREAQHTAEHVLANAGSRSGLFVEDYVREYEGEDGLTQADQQRLDRLSVLALAEAERMLTRQEMQGSVNADALDVQVELNLGEMNDGEAARVWAEAIVASVSQSARPSGTFTEPSHPHLARKELDWDWSDTVAPQDWKYSDRIIWNDTPGGVTGRPDNTFIKAAIRNTKASDPGQYVTIGQRSNYYEVMSNIIQQNPACKDVKFFDAAAQVTNARSVGAVEHFWGSGFGSGPLALRGTQAKSIYTDVNAELFTANMDVINSLLYRTKAPTSPLVPGSTTPISATAFDLEMVEKEQGIVEAHLAKYKATFSAETIAEINRDLNYKGVYRTIGEITFWPLGDAKASYWAKAALGVGDLDFFDRTHRIAIGKAKVFALHGLTQKDYAAHIHSAPTPPSAGAAGSSSTGTPVVPPQRRALPGTPSDPGPRERAAQATEARIAAGASADTPSRSLMAMQFGFQPLRSQAYGTLEQEAEHVSAAVRNDGPHAAPALSTAPLGIQNYDTYEHVKFGGEPGNQRMVTINGVVVSYGELISMGDFFENPDQIYDTPPAQLKALVDMIRRQVADPKSVTDSDWAKVSPRYLDLATKNDAHFAPPNPSLVAPGGSPGPDHRQTWERLHKQALDLAQDGQTDRALATNAFGDHFLTDAFATGHLINKGDVMARFRSRFADSNTRASFFKAVAQNVWADSSVEAYVSQYETGESYALGWHPNINSASRFSEFLSGVYKAQPDVIDNAVVKIVHDRLNNTVGGLEVHNAAGQLWHLSGDNTLNSESLEMGRRAVYQSQQNISGVSSGRVPQPGNKNDKGYTGDVQPLYKKVWNYCPIPTDASVKVIHDVIETMTNPNAQETIVAAGVMIREKIHTIIEEAVRLKKLRKA